MIIRTEQVEALKTVALEVFTERVTEHLRRFFPRHAEAAGDALPKLARQAIERARVHGLTSQQAACRYAAIACVLGSDFDERFDWAARITASSATPDLKIELLVEQALEHLRSPA